MIDRQKEHRFNQLGLDHRAAHGHDRLARENRRALRNGPDVAAEFKIGEIREEFLIEDPDGAQIPDILLGKGEGIEVVDELLHTGHDGEAAVVGNTAEEHVEVGDRVPVAVREIAVRHGHLVEIGKHRQVFAVKLLFCHRSHLQTIKLSRGAPTPPPLCFFSLYQIAMRSTNEFFPAAFRKITWRADPRGSAGQKCAVFSCVFPEKHL